MSNPGKGLSRALGIGKVVDMTTSAVGRAITLPGTGGRDAQATADSTALAEQQARQTEALGRAAAAQERQMEIARASADAALASQNEAAKRAAAAAVPSSDSESAQRAADARLRNLIASSTFGVKSGQRTFGAAPVGFRALTGS